MLWKLEFGLSLLSIPLSTGSNGPCASKVLALSAHLLKSPWIMSKVTFMRFPFRGPWVNNQGGLLGEWVSPVVTEKSESTLGVGRIYSVWEVMLWCQEADLKAKLFDTYKWPSEALTAKVEGCDGVMPFNSHSPGQLYFVWEEETNCILLCGE